MRKYLKTSLYFTVVLLACLFIVVIYNVIFNSPVVNTTDGVSIALIPTTPEEQKELIAAQEEEESSVHYGPLVADMSAMDAQSRVLTKTKH